MADALEKMPACLMDIQAVSRNDMWFDVVPGRSNRYFTLPRPLVWAGKYHCEEYGLWVVLEVHWLTSECFLQEDNAARRLRKNYSRLCLFTSDDMNGSYVFRCADFIRPEFGPRIVTPKDAEFFARRAFDWIERGFKSTYWKSPAMVPLLPWFK